MFYLIRFVDSYLVCVLNAVDRLFCLGSKVFWGKKFRESEGRGDGSCKGFKPQEVEAEIEATDSANWLIFPELQLIRRA